MATLVYAPEVTIRIRTQPESRGKGKIIDVTEDISSGSVHRIVNGVSTANVTLLNQNRKYDGMFSPMDTIVVYLKRIRTVLKFAGYLDDTPKWSSKPGSINLTASCSMKRLQHFQWDPSSDQAFALLNSALDDSGGAQMQDGGAAKRTVDLLHTVAGWPKAQIHIARIPENWYDKISKVADQLIAEGEAARMAATVGSGSWLGGISALNNGAATSITGIGPGTGYLPAARGKISHFGGPNGGAYGNMALTGESGVNPRDPWYCAMRWPYTGQSDDFASQGQGPVAGAKEWWKNRKILVVNPKNEKAVVLRAADWGPAASTGRVIDVSPHALKTALGGKTDDIVHIAFAPADAALGPVDLASGALGNMLGNQNAGSPTGAGSAVTTGWGAPGDERNIVNARGGGKSFQCHRFAKVKFEGFLNDLVSIYGYSPKVVGGYNDRNIAGTNKKSNHAWGAAIDIDPTKNPFTTGSQYALPKPPGIVQLARKWGLGWGGEWSGAKDYMHFEVIGAPASSTYEVDGKQVGPGESTSVVVSKWSPPIAKGKYTVTARFGESGSSWANGHSGTDFAAAGGTPIHPVGPGTVWGKGYDDSYGNWVSVDHGGQHYTFYAHMEEASPLAIGTPVATSTTLGGVGQTGNARGNHVHVEYRRGADTYAAAQASGGIEKYVLGGSNRADPPSGTQAVEGDYSEISPDLSADQIGQGLFNVQLFNLSAYSEASNLLGGYRALINDEPIFGTVQQLMGVANRDFCSAPNGDFIAWFPDYFGHYGQAGKMVISSLEISGLSGPPTVNWTDRTLKTHQFVSGATAGGAGDAGEPWRLATTAGVASIEFPELMMALMNISRKEAEHIRDTYLNRFGPRVEVAKMNNITGARQEFFYACHLFQKNWGQQYQADLNLTFVPELYPGMLACFPEYGIQGYVMSTTDNFNMTGGGFSVAYSTSITCAPWSSLGKNDKAAADGLPIGAPL